MWNSFFTINPPLYLLDIDTPLGLSTSAIVALSIININVYDMPYFKFKWGNLIEIMLRFDNISKADMSENESGKRRMA